jgi:acyl carrier protein
VRPPLPLGAHGIVTVSDLRLPIEASLPPYMVPSMFVLLDELPLTANGKIERKALPSPEEVAFGARSGPPSTELEKRIANVWTEVLGLEAVGVDDDFFEIGGHSILAIRLAAKLSEAIGKEVPLMTIFEAPTVAALAAEVRQAGDRSLKALDTPPPASGLSAAVNESMWENPA